MKALKCEVAYTTGVETKILMVAIGDGGRITFSPYLKLIPNLSMLDIAMTRHGDDDVRIFTVSKTVDIPKHIVMSMISALKSESYEVYCEEVSLMKLPWLSAVTYDALHPSDGSIYVPLVEGSINHSTLIILAKGKLLETLIGRPFGTPEFFDRVQKWKRFGSPAMTPATGKFVKGVKLRVAVIPEDDQKSTLLASKGYDAQAHDGDMFLNATKVEILVKKYVKDVDTKYEPLQTAQFRYRESDDADVYEVWKGVIRDCPQWKFIQMCEQHGFNHKEVDIITSEGNIKSSNLSGKRIQEIDTTHLGLLNVNNTGPCSISRQPITATCLVPAYQKPLADLYEYLRAQGVDYDAYDGTSKKKKVQSVKMFFDVLAGDLVATANLLNMNHANGFEDIVATQTRLVLFPVRGADGVWRVPAYKTARTSLAPKLVGMIRGDILSVEQKNPSFAMLSSLYSEDLDNLRFAYAKKAGKNVVPVVLTHEQGRAYDKFYSRHANAKNCMITFPVAGVPNLTEIAPVSIGKDGSLELWEPGKRMLTDQFMGIPVSQMYSMIKDCDGDTVYLYLFPSDHHMPVSKLFKITKATKDAKPECNDVDTLYALLMNAELIAEAGIGLADAAIAKCATMAIAANKSLAYAETVKLQEILELVIKAEQRGKVSGKTIPEFIDEIVEIASFGSKPHRNPILNTCFGSFGLGSDTEDGGSVPMVSSWIDQCHKAVPICDRIEKQGNLFPYAKMIREVSSRQVKGIRVQESDASFIRERLVYVLDYFTTTSTDLDVLKKRFHVNLVTRCRSFVFGDAGLNERYCSAIAAEMRPEVFINSAKRTENISKLIAGFKDEIHAFVWCITMKDAPMDQELTELETTRYYRITACLALVVGIAGFTKTRIGGERGGGAFFTCFTPRTYNWIAKYYYENNPVLAGIAETIEL